MTNWQQSLCAKRRPTRRRTAGVPENAGSDRPRVDVDLPGRPAIQSRVPPLFSIIVDRNPAGGEG
ncbi:MAG: hypothetical protein D6725_02555 [Planctomycetota bacterium]|nr:MAG: hypothetical protein D6725_02555 [Planctomycetota bacterium]